MKVLLIDNYDSFTYNLVHCMKQIPGCEITVVRNDKIEPEAIEAFDKLVLSPGPGIPDEAGNLKELIKHAVGKLPVFGVCLGLQAITEVFGGKLFNAETVYHGVATTMHVVDREDPLFKELPDEFLAGRYHSWMADEDSLPDSLKVTARDENKHIMAVSHKSHPIHAVQFHPESVLTEHGQQIIENFINHSK
jgi:anthranilate synthase component 2